MGGGCGPGDPGIIFLDEVKGAASESENWRHENHNIIVEANIKNLKDAVSYGIEDIRRDIERAQNRYHQADNEVKYQSIKYRGTDINPDPLGMARKEREESLQELQRQKARIEKVEDWRNTKIREIWALRDRAKNGDYHGYRRLWNYDTTYNPSLFK